MIVEVSRKFEHKTHLKVSQNDSEKTAKTCKLRGNRWLLCFTNGDF